MKKVLTFLTFYLIISSAVLAQIHAVSGTVTSQEDGSTLPGVTVMIKGTTQGAITAIDGKYWIADVLPSSVIVFSFVGFTPVEITVGDQRTIDVSLKPAMVNLDEVVVTALGVKREKREIGYSSEKMNPDLIQLTQCNQCFNGPFRWCFCFAGRWSRWGLNPNSNKGEQQPGKKSPASDCGRQCSYG